MKPTFTPSSPEADLVWHDKPGFFVLAGATLILLSGLYIALASRTHIPLTEGN